MDNFCGRVFFVNSNNLLIRLKPVLLPDVLGVGARLDDVELILYVTTGAESFFDRQPPTPAAVPAACLNGQAVGADAELGERLALAFLHGCCCVACTLGAPKG